MAPADSPSVLPAVRYLVGGRVQGVAFRAATAACAAQLGVHGWAKNLADGRVEVVAAGPMPALVRLTAWVWDGPPAARVDAVYMEEWGAAVPAGFSVL
jgi:acylphosphatase